MRIRQAEPSEIEALARLWHDGWQDAHAAILPPALARHRTLASFAERLADGLPRVRTIGAIGQPLGFAMIKGDEMYQLYVGAAARGSGVAAMLLADAEARQARAGVSRAWLACAIGNERAARFYTRQGWTLAGNMINRLDTPAGIFDLEVWRYEKTLARA
ncbi:N-acetyltransferase family protein [Pseudoxanthomonas sp.]|jgi:GNAT superfamily N-acetyltransferase|uniref:GNAT family N-acetyltransferase n=1 Tax=Pseudoxanthomonas sp. TaxID=1871049 RepID=UPI003F7D5F18